jgi:hypothetical protein
MLGIAFTYQYTGLLHCKTASNPYFRASRPCIYRALPTVELNTITVNFESNTNVI